jgi:metal-responsive CopG/Arc/MetJ family transcriptional regulator
VKTAVSIPDSLYAEAEELAHELGMSRSKLYAAALQEYLAARAESDVTARLNEVYADCDSTLEPGWKELQAKAIERNE